MPRHLIFELRLLDHDQFVVDTILRLFFEGLAEIEADDLVRTTRLVFENISGTGYEEPEDLERWLQDDGRVILRIRPKRVFGVIR